LADLNVLAHIFMLIIYNIQFLLFLSVGLYNIGYLDRLYAVFSIYPIMSQVTFEVLHPKRYTVF